MADEWVCWKCGTAIAPLKPAIGRIDECVVCRADLHVCRLCVFFDERVSRQCREPVADEVTDKTRANFCGYFEVRTNAHRHDSTAASSRAALDNLFVTPAAAASAAAAPPNEEERARRQLAELFGSHESPDKK